MKNEWFRDWFDEYYPLVYRHRDESEAAGFIRRTPIWDRLDYSSAGIDLGCGEGRYTRALAGRLAYVLGIDLSSSMLRAAVERSKGVGNIHLVCADLRHLPVRGPFDLAVSMFTSFGYFDEDENVALIRSVAGLLNPGGFFVLDVANAPAVIRRIESKPRSTYEVDGFIIHERRGYDPVSSRVSKRIAVRGGNVEREYWESVRIYNYDELRELLTSSGFEPIARCWGDYDGSRYTNESPRIIFFGVQKA